MALNHRTYLQFVQVLVALRVQPDAVPRRGSVGVAGEAAGAEGGQELGRNRLHDDPAQHLVLLKGSVPQGSLPSRTTS